MRLKKIISHAFVIGMYLVCACNQVTESGKKATLPTLFTQLSADKTNIFFQNTLTEALNTNILMYERQAILIMTD
jgi:enediyne biosynthesis protein E4